MPSGEIHYHIDVKINGSPLADEEIDVLQEAVVDQSLYLPDMCTLAFEFDKSLDHVNKANTYLGQTVEIALTTRDLDRITLFKGEITAVEPAFGDSMRGTLVIRGYDKSWRLYRESKNKVFAESKDSDISDHLSRDAGLSTQVESTSEVFKHLIQGNQSDMEYLLERARRIGFQTFVQDGTLYFRKADPTGSAVDLTWGTDLKSFEPRATLAEQVSEVIVQGWDKKKKEPIIGKSTSSTTHPAINIGGSGMDVAQSKIAHVKRLITDIPVQSQADADAVAKGHLDRINGSFVQAEGVASDRPDITAGGLVNITEVGTKFSGTYMVTSATHIYRPDGFETHFSVRGSNTGTFAELLGNQDPIKRWHGLYPAIVTDNQSNEDDWGQVKVTFPWLHSRLDSHWARVISPGAGKERGFYLLPEIDDEVIVAFEQGDINRPYVVGGVWNGKDKPPEAISNVVQNGEVVHRIWKSRAGHYMLFDDTKNAEKFEIVMNCGHKVTLDDKNKEILIVSGSGVKVKIDQSSNVTLEAAQNIEIKANGNISMEAKGNMNLKATGNLTAEATGNFSAKGAQSTFEGTARTELKAPTVSVSGSALTEVKGALVKIN